MPKIKRPAGKMNAWPKLPDRRKYSDPEEYLIKLDKALKKRELANK